MLMLILYAAIAFAIAALALWAGAQIIRDPMLANLWRVFVVVVLVLVVLGLFGVFPGFLAAPRIG
jgi:protein-S-isoprenylcysteine O-methyltransferase Ste14